MHGPIGLMKPNLKPKKPFGLGTKHHIWRKPNTALYHEHHVSLNQGGIIFTLSCGDAFSAAEMGKLSFLALLNVRHTV